MVKIEIMVNLKFIFWTFLAIIGSNPVTSQIHIGPHIWCSLGVLGCAFQISGHYKITQNIENKGHYKITQKLTKMMKMVKIQVFMHFAVLCKKLAKMVNLGLVP